MGSGPQVLCRWLVGSVLKSPPHSSESPPLGQIQEVQQQPRARVSTAEEGQAATCRGRGYWMGGHFPHCVGLSRRWHHGATRPQTQRVTKCRKCS